MGIEKKDTNTTINTKINVEKNSKNNFGGKKYEEEQVKNCENKKNYNSFDEGDEKDEIKHEMKYKHKYY